MASPLKGLLTDIVALGTSRLVGRTVELTRPNGAIVARVERVALVPSDPVPARMLDPVTWWLDTIDGATTGVGQLFGVGSVPDDSAGRIDLLESGELTLRDVTVGGRRIDRVEAAASEVGAVIGLRQLVRTGPVSMIATLTADDVRTWLPAPANDAGRSLRLRGDGRLSVRWKRGWLVGEVAARIEPHAETVDLVADRLVIAGREFVIPSRSASASVGVDRAAGDRRRRAARRRCGRRPPHRLPDAGQLGSPIHVRAARTAAPSACRSCPARRRRVDTASRAVTAPASPSETRMDAATASGQQPPHRLPVGRRGQIVA